MRGGEGKCGDVSSNPQLDLPNPLPNSIPTPIPNQGTIPNHRNSHQTPHLFSRARRWR